MRRWLIRRKEQKKYIAVKEESEETGEISYIFPGFWIMLFYLGTEGNVGEFHTRDRRLDHDVVHLFIVSTNNTSFLRKRGISFFTIFHCI